MAGFPLKYKSTTKSYNNFGVIQDTQIERHHFDDSYIGIGFRYENIFLIEVEPRKYFKRHEKYIQFGTGIVLSF